MTDAIIALIVLAVMAVLFVLNKPPIALTALGGAAALVLLGVLPAEEMFAALSGNTIVLIAAMMVIGAGLFHTGVAEALAARIVRVTGTTENGLMLGTLLVGTIVSSIASGVAVVAMLLPVIIGISKRAQISTSRQLIPLAFAASFGGNLTLVGAASNVVVSGQMEGLGVRGLTFFEIAKVGIPVMIAAILYFMTIGKKFLTPGDSSDETYLAEYTHRDSPGFDRVRGTISIVVLFAALITMIIDIELLPMYLVAVIGALIMILTGCIKEDSAYRAIDWSTIFVIAGMSAVTAAMAESGAAALIGNATVSLLGENPNKFVVLLVIFAVVMVLTNLMLNTSTTLLLTPLFIPVAQAVDVNPVAVGIAICVAASSPFVSPVGSGTNTLIVKPGGLKFMDFFRPGLGLSVVVLVVSMIAIPIGWPL